MELRKSYAYKNKYTYLKIHAFISPIIQSLLSGIVTVFEFICCLYWN